MANIIYEIKDMTRMMRGVLVNEFGPPEVCKYRADLPIPEPGDDEVQIRVYAAGINPVETYIRSGNYARKPQLPYTPGNDSAGVVTKIGKNVKTLSVGDRVFTVDSETGTYAEFTVSLARRVFKLPDNLTFLEGSAICTPYFTAYRAVVTKAQSRPGENMLIHGASGAVGIGSIQLAKSLGLHVIGTAGTPEGLKMIKELGCDQVYNHREAGYIEKIKEAYPNGLEIILEMSSHTNLNRDLELLKFKRGRVVVIGCRGTIEINPRLVMAKEASIIGMMLHHRSHPHDESFDEDFETVNAYLQAQMRLNVIKPVIAKTYSLTEVDQAHKDVVGNSGTMGRLAFKIE